MQEVMITPGTFFDGYIATEYKDPVAVEEIIYVEAVYISRIENEKNMSIVQRALGGGRERALQRIKRYAKDVGCNGLIGFDCKYMPLNPSNDRVLNKYSVCIIAQGTPVKIEKTKA